MNPAWNAGILPDSLEKMALLDVTSSWSKSDINKKNHHHHHHVSELQSVPRRARSARIRRTEGTDAGQDVASDSRPEQNNHSRTPRALIMTPAAGISGAAPPSPGRNRPVKERLG